MKIDKTRLIYGTMYGGSCRNDSNKRVVLIQSEELQYKETCMYYIWGYPGPDYNVYKECDYEETWAYKLEDFVSEVEYIG